MKESTGNPWTTIKLGVISVSALVVAFWIWNPVRERTPRQLIGEWHTTDPKYSDRALTIDESTINFGGGNGIVSVGFIDRVKAEPAGSRTLFTVAYTLDGAHNQVSFYYEDAHDKTIRFKSQEQIIWTKDE